jgi:hypothetical protein
LACHWHGPSLSAFRLGSFFAKGFSPPEPNRLEIRADTYDNNNNNNNNRTYLQNMLKVKKNGESLGFRAFEMLGVHISPQGSEN